MTTTTDATPIDDVDRRIIDELQRDGRISFAQLGPRVGLSQAATRQRVNRLLSRDVIRVVALVNRSALGHGQQATVGVKVVGDARATAEALAAHPEVTQIIGTAGRFDLLVSVACRTGEELFALVNERVRATPGVHMIEIMQHLHIAK